MEYSDCMNKLDICVVAMRNRIARKESVTKGFTLIELLVVIAIIGILSSVVLASLNAARAKGSDAAIKANLANGRAEAELFYDTAGNYNGVCAATGTSVIGDGVKAAATAAGIANGAYSIDAIGSGTTAVCNDTTTGWAAQVGLKSSTTQVYCVDSSGLAVVSTNKLTATTDDSCL